MCYLFCPHTEFPHWTYLKLEISLVGTQRKKMIAPLKSISYVPVAIVKYNEQNKLKEEIDFDL